MLGAAGVVAGSHRASSEEYSVRVSDYRFLLYAIVWYGALAVDGWAVTFGTGWQFWNTC